MVRTISRCYSILGTVNGDAQHGIRELANCKMGDSVVGTTIKENVSRVTICADMKVSSQSVIAASKSNNILGLIKIM